jgi:hypothetical protein
LKYVKQLWQAMAWIFTNWILFSFLHNY